MRILHLTPELPYWPGGTGGSTRQFQLLRRLVELGHEVSVVSPATAEQAQQVAKLAEAGIDSHVYQRPASRHLEALRALAHRPALVWSALVDPVLVWQVNVFWTRMLPVVRDQLRANPPDVVCLEHDHALLWRDDLPESTRIVLTSQNVLWDYYATRSAAASGAQSALLRAEGLRAHRFVASRIGRFDAVVAVSDRDSAQFRRAGATSVHVVPNGVDTDAITPAGRPADSPVVVFTGTLNYVPNEEGLIWFAEHVWPAVFARVPDARLLIVGRSPTPKVLRLSALDGIEVVGPVPSVVPYLQQAMAAVVPLRSGGGTRLKVCEALAAGLPVVSTTVGVEGIDVMPDRDYLRADRPEDFSRRLEEILRDGELRTRLSIGARRAAMAYDWRELGDRFEATLAHVCEPAALGSAARSTGGTVDDASTERMPGPSVLG